MNKLIQAKHKCNLVPAQLKGVIAEISQQVMTSLGLGYSVYLWCLHASRVLPLGRCNVDNNTYDNYSCTNNGHRLREC